VKNGTKVINKTEQIPTPLSFADANHFL